LDVISRSEFLGADLNGTFDELPRRVAARSIAGEWVDRTLSREVGLDVFFV